MFKSIKLPHIIAPVAIGVSQVIIIYVSYRLSLVSYLLLLYPIDRVSMTNTVRQTHGAESHTLTCNTE